MRTSLFYTAYILFLHFMMPIAKKFNTLNVGTICKLVDRKEIVGYLPLTKQMFLKLLVLKPHSYSKIFVCIDQ